MKTPGSVVAGVDFGDAELARAVRDGVDRVEALMRAELGRADDLMAEAVQHLFTAGGKRFRPLFTVLCAQLGPDPDSEQVTVAGAVIEQRRASGVRGDVPGGGCRGPRDDGAAVGPGTIVSGSSAAGSCASTGEKIRTRYCPGGRPLSAAIW